MDLKKLQEYVFYALVFLIPCNLAKHWPQNWSYVHGILTDYLIPTVYLTDILILILLGLWLIEVLSENFSRCFNDLIFKLSKKRNLIFWLIGLLIYCLINIFLSKNRPAAVYKWLKVIELILFTMYVKKQTSISKNIIKVLSLSISWQSILAIWQWLKQGSVFGYWFFGEQLFNSATLGIKTIFFLGQVKVLPMGTFPHPNILAGFLVTNLILILILTLLFPAHGRRSNITILAFLLGSTALFLTFSYPAWLAFTLVLSIKGQNSKKLTIPAFCRLLLVSAVIIGIIAWGKNQGWVENYYSASSWSRRGQLNKIAFDLWLTSPIFGVGLNNFIPRMEEFGQVIADYRFLQPVHNLFLLILSEGGLIGITLAIYGLTKIIKPEKLVNKKLGLLRLALLMTLLFLGSFDHYWLTIQQGMLGASIVIGFC